MQKAGKKLSYLPTPNMAGLFDDPQAGAALRRWLQARNELSLFAWNPLFLMRVKG